jgi:hypothetical protein
VSGRTLGSNQGLPRVLPDADEFALVLDFTQAAAHLVRQWSQALCVSARTASTTRMPGRLAVELTADGTGRGKPDPEVDLRALELLGVDLDPEVAPVFEDTEASPRHAAPGWAWWPFRGTLEPDRLGEAEELVDRVDSDLLRHYLH